MSTRAINPWTWQDAYGFSQGVEAKGGGRWLLCAGQTSVDENGSPLHAGDMAAQLRQAFDNLEAVLTGRLGPTAAAQRTAELIAAITGLAIVDRAAVTAPAAPVEAETVARV